MFKNILLPTDGSPLSRKAVTKSVGANVIALFAAPPATPIIYRDSLPFSYATPDEQRKVLEKIAAKHIGYIERAAAKAGVRCEPVQVTSDYPEDDILKVAKKKKCDLIVMGTRGQSGIRAAVFGSVTQKVIANSEIPILVVP
jgi:nucleotide-binding universal stress UspA family protein